MKRQDFQHAASLFRAGRISLADFTDQVCEGGEVAVQGASSKRSATMKLEDNSVVATPEGQFTMPFRPVEAHKGDFGRVLVVGGCETMPGSIAMTAMSTLRSGSGLVIALTPEEAEPVVSGFSPCPMVVGLDSKSGLFSKNALDEILEHTEWADVVAIGPGMGRSKAGQKIMKRLYEKLPQPIVVDADGLNNLADGGVDLSVHEGLRILTPHPGEFRRLVKTKTSDRAEMEAEAIELAANAKITLVLKGHHTLVTDGSAVHRNESGNSGMATAGSGDVLTGVITSLLGQGLSPIDAATTGCYVHGVAGDLAANKFGEISMIATDVVDSLPAAFKSLESKS